MVGRPGDSGYLNLWRYCGLMEIGGWFDDVSDAGSSCTLEFRGGAQFDLNCTVFWFGEF